MPVLPAAPEKPGNEGKNGNRPRNTLAAGIDEVRRRVLGIPVKIHFAGAIHRGPGSETPCARVVPPRMVIILPRRRIILHPRELEPIAIGRVGLGDDVAEAVVDDVVELVSPSC